MSETPNTPKNIAGPAQKSGAGWLKIRYVWLGLLVVIVLVAGSAYWLNKRNNKASSAAGPATYHYVFKQAVPYTLSGSSKASGVAFREPPGFSAVSPPALKGASKQTLLVQPATSSSSPDIARIAVAELSLSPAPTADFLANLAKVLANPQDPNYQAQIQPLEDFVSARLPKTYAVGNFSIARPLTTSNLTINAYSLGFSATSSTAANPPIVGQAVLAYGKQTAYYFMAQSVGTYWQSNVLVWQQIINSIKLDQ